MNYSDCFQYIHHRKAAASSDEDQHSFYSHGSSLGWREVERSHDTASGIPQVTSILIND